MNRIALVVFACIWGFFPLFSQNANLPDANALPVPGGHVVHKDKANTTYVFNKLVWSDECNGTGIIDTSKWFHQTILPNGSSWYNGEIQHYTNRIENSFIDTGYLHIIAKKERFIDQGVVRQYTSARLNSKFAFTYGKVEIRAKLPSGVGTWPAMWTLGKNITENGAYWFNQGFGTVGWPECGEIDIMEHWGHNQNYVSSAMHTPSSYGGTINLGGQIVANASSEFHIYKLEWTPEKMVFSVDDVSHYTYDPDIKNADTWPFDEDQYLLLNIAILPEISASFTESSLVLDYIRVYQDSSASSTGNLYTHNLSCYPNPFVNELTIDLGELPDQDMVLKIHDSKGSLVKAYKIPYSGNKIILEDLDNLSSGLYIVSCKIHNKSYSLRIAKE